MNWLNTDALCTWVKATLLDYLSLGNLFVYSILSRLFVINIRRLVKNARVLVLLVAVKLLHKSLVIINNRPLSLILLCGKHSPSTNLYRILSIFIFSGFLIPIDFVWIIFFRAGWSWMWGDVLNNRVVNAYTSMSMVFHSTTDARLACLRSVLWRFFSRVGIHLESVLLTHWESLMLKSIMTNALCLQLLVFLVLVIVSLWDVIWLE